MWKRPIYWIMWVGVPAFLAILLSSPPNSLARPTLGNPTVIFSEIAWGGTAANSSDEWMELYNLTGTPIDLTNWTIVGNSINITLNGTIPANGFFLLERTDDLTISDLPANQIYTGGLSNSGETLTLRDAGTLVIDSANNDGGSWGGGTGSPDYFSMERVSPDAPDLDDNWMNNDGITRNGLDASGNPLNATPTQPNSAWDIAPPEDEPDLVVGKTGPAQADAGTSITYQLTLQNNGFIPAVGVLLTDTLPIGLSYLSDNSGLPHTQPNSQTIVWTVGTVLTSTILDFDLTVAIAPNLNQSVTNQLVASTTTPETNTSNNTASATTQVSDGTAPIILLNAVYYDGYVDDQPDEAIELVNVGTATADLTGWSIDDESSSSSKATLPAGTTLAPGQTIWLTKEATAFAFAFAFLPDFEVSNTVPAIAKLTGSWPGYADNGDEVVLTDNGGQIIDVLVYEDGLTSQNGWLSEAVEPFTVGSTSGSDGQILYRQRSQTTGLPISDTNTATDWAQSSNDLVNGRKVRYPGWDLDTFFFTTQATEFANLTIAIAPDNAYEAVVEHINTAQETILIETLTFENLGVADALIDALNRGVEVTVLLEGGPTGGLTDQEKYVCQELEAAGGQCWFMISDANADIYDRYSYLHAKFILVDDERVSIASENLSLNSLPNDDKSDGTWGRRGVVLFTDAPSVVAQIKAIFEADLDPYDPVTNPYGHRDLVRWSENDPTYGSPSLGFIPVTESGGITYTVRYPEPTTVQGTFFFELVHSPENSLRDQDSLLGMIGQAGVGDTLLVQQLDEPLHWGASNSNSTDDPNLRLEAYIEAARRGATVRILLDSELDDEGSPTSNLASCDYVRQIARSEGLRLECALGNPTGLGIHNKMVLAEIDGDGYIFAGSINGSEQSSKGNREVALLVQSDQAYTVLKDMFRQDFPNQLYLPIASKSYQGILNYALISEVFYDPAGTTDEAEFVEIINPTHASLDLSNYSIGDAVNNTDFEDVRRFPAGTVLASREMVVIAKQATSFQLIFGFLPDFEIIDTHPNVPQLIDDPAWGDPEAFFQLGNTGDEVILRAPNNQVVDVLVYGMGMYPGVLPCADLDSDHSLERYPYWRDTNNCAIDFRDRFPATPGVPAQ